MMSNPFITESQNILISVKKAILLCGSNQGDRVQNMRSAIALLSKSEQIQLLNKSSFYETAPWGDSDQEAFLNQALLIETDLSPFQLLQLIKDIEGQVGRVNTRRWGPRIIDIDILYFDNLVLQSEILTIPHAEVQNRAFALVPAAEIAPKWMDTRNKNSIAALCQNCPDTLSVKKIELSENAV